jgi:hypothetical protein
MFAFYEGRRYNNAIMGNQHRPINERIAETQAQLAALMARQAKVEVSKDPQIQELDELIKNLNSQVIKLNRWENEAVEKFANFIKRAEAWKIKGEDAKSQKPSVLQALNATKAERKALAESLAVNMELDTEDME